MLLVGKTTDFCCGWLNEPPVFFYFDYENWVVLPWAMASSHRHT